MQYSDAVEFAAQTGRLDFLSALLAAIAVLFAAGAFPVWFFLRRKAFEVAREEVKAVWKL